MIWFRQLNIYIGLFKKNYVGIIEVDSMSIVHTINDNCFSEEMKHYAMEVFAVKEYDPCPGDYIQ